MNLRFTRLVTLPALFILAMFAATNCFLAISGQTHFWRYQWPCVFAVVGLTAVQCWFELSKRTEQ